METYGKWLKRQSIEFITTEIGSNNVARFLNGDLRISKYKDLTGIIYTLDDLLVLESQCFDIEVSN